MRYSVIICLLLAGCAGPERIVSHEVAAPVEKLVYRQLDPSLFEGCPPMPEALKDTATNADLLANRDQWKLIAICDRQLLETIRALK